MTRTMNSVHALVSSSQPAAQRVPHLLVDLDRATTDILERLLARPATTAQQSGAGTADTVVGHRAVRQEKGRCTLFVEAGPSTTLVAESSRPSCDLVRSAAECAMGYIDG
jgi:hypothetical protein